MLQRMKVLKIVVLTTIVGLLVTAIFLLYDIRVQERHLKTDQQTLSALNYAVGQYNAFEDEPLFEEGITDVNAILLALEEHGYINTRPTLEARDAAFVWQENNQIFRLVVGDVIQPLSIYGDSFSEIAPSLADLINQRFEDTGAYGRTFGSGRFLDLGLNPEDWQYPLLHLYYLPSGSQLKIYLEAGYIAQFDDLSGETLTLVLTQNQPLIYNDLDGHWYYQSIDSTQRVDIDTFDVSWQD